MMTETSQSIAAWAEATFGPAPSLIPLAERAQDELCELLAAIKDGGPDKDIAMEAADVTILLHRMAGILGFDLSALVDEKMAFNKTRQWPLAGDGTGQHT